MRSNEASQSGSPISATASERAAVSSSAKTSTTGTLPVATVFEPEPLGAFWSFLAVCIALLVVLLYLSVCFHWTGPAATFALTALPVGLVTVGCLPINTVPKRLRGRIIANDSVQRAFTGITGTRTERLYGDVVLLLLGNGEKISRRDYRLRHDILRECNSLLRDHLRIEKHRRRVQRLLESSEPLAEVEAEYIHLVARMEAETDSVARHSLEESAALCAERADSLKALQPMLSRLNAHNEVICQALLLARTALTRAQAVPVALTAPDISGLRDAVRRVTYETKAVEEAVTELTHF